MTDVKRWMERVQKETRRVDRATLPTPGSVLMNPPKLPPFVRAGPEDRPAPKTPVRVPPRR